MPRRPAKRTLEAAVKDMQTYLGCIGKVQFRDEQRLYQRVQRRVQRIADTAGLDAENTWGQIEGEARKRGVHCLPGRDL